MEEFINDIKDYFKDNNIEIEIEGELKKSRRKRIIKTLDKLLEDRETKKLEIAKKLINNYLAIDKLMNNLEDIPYYKEFSRNGPNAAVKYIKVKLEDFKECLVAVMSAMAKDIKKFYKKLIGWEKWEDEDGLQVLML